MTGKQMMPAVRGDRQILGDVLHALGLYVLGAVALLVAVTALILVVGLGLS